MIEVILKDFLTSKGFNAKTERPKAIIYPFNLIERTGGYSANHGRRATVAIQSYGASLYKACKESEDVLKAIKYSLPLESGRVTAIEVNSGPYNYTDATTNEYRYQTVYDIYYSEE